MDEAEFNTLTQSQLAARTGLDQSTWSKLFSGDRCIKEELLAVPARKLGLTPTELACLCRRRSIIHLEARLRKTSLKLKALRRH